MLSQQRGHAIGASLVLHALRRAALGLGLGLYGLSSVAQVSVSNSGSPNYSHPIAVPPGISGMQPNLSLKYSGGGANGPVGHGWSVQGMSMITRCPATRYTDAVPRGVKFDANDKLCLDGQRLIQTDANGVPAAFPQTNDALGLASGYREYRTENDSYARIRAYDIANTNAVNGPAGFKVWTKSGQIYEYGLNTNVPISANAAIAAQGKNVIMVWAVGRISDVTNNYIDFKYTVRDTAWGSGPTAGSPTLGREWNIAEIQYTGNSSVAQLPTNKVIFRYSDRTETRDRGEAYQQGSKNISIRRLDAIETYVNSPSNTNAVGTGTLLVKRTRLTYDASGVTKRSRLASIKDCTDAAETKCLPPTAFGYSAGGSDAFTASPSFNLTTTALHNNTGTMGVIPIDFDGDGKTDLLRWSDTPAQNQLWKSNGNGAFTQVAAFDITTDSLYKSDQCFSSQVADFNGDGIPDLLRLMRANSSAGASCGTVSHKLYLGSGSGSFNAVALTGVDFTQIDSVKLDRYNCISPPSSGYISGCLEPGTVYQGSSRTQGRNYYLIDVNSDGYLDIVTTMLPAYSWSNPPPTDQSLCASTPCTRIYLGSATGAFTAFTSTNVTNAALYSRAPTPTSAFNSNILPSVVDVDGDGLMDLAVDNGTYLSRGDGNFTFDPASTQTAQTCVNPVDFNGDGRTDCLFANYGLALQSLRASDGSNTPKFIASFNLKTTGHELSGIGIGFQTFDVNADGRSDILRWKDDPLQNRVYLSNGDGSFTASTTFNLTSSTFQLAKSDNTSTFTLGDFLGNGTIQILRLKHSPTAGAATANQLYAKTAPTLPDQLLPDQLVSVTGPTGLRTTLTYGSLADASSGRYTNDRSDSTNRAVYPLVDLTIASPVVVTTTSDVGVGINTLQTQYAYKGLKAALDGRGMLGFRQMVQSNKTPTGSDLSVWTDYLLGEPYAGMGRSSQTRLGAWNAPTAQLLSTTSSTYCDRTSATDPNAATDAVPCATTARVRRPYLRRTIETGADLDGTALPTVTTVNTYNDYGDPTNIVVTTSGAVAGVANQTTTKTTANTFCAPDSAGCPNRTAGDNWILGRITRATVTNTVPNLLASIAASPGDAPNATAIAGTGAVPTQPALALGSCTSTGPTTTPTAATMSCTLSNTGQAAANSISYATAPSTTVSGPTGLCAAGATCGTVTVTTATSAAAYSGTLTATPNVGSAASLGINLMVNAALTPPALAFSGCTSTTPTTAPTAANMTCALGNTGQTPVTSISYTTAASTTASGPTGACAASATCGTVTVTTATTAGSYAGTLTATPNSGSGASQPVGLVVNAPAPFISTSPASHAYGSVQTTASQTFTVSNTGGPGAIGISLSSSVSGRYTLGARTCPADGVTMAGSSACTIVVTYRAQLQCGGSVISRVATLQVSVGSSSANAALNAADWVYSGTAPQCR